MIALAAALLEYVGPYVLAIIGLALIIPLMTAIRALVNGVPFVGGQLSNALGGVWQWFESVIAGLLRNIEYAGNQILQVVGNVVVTIVRPVTDYLNSLVWAAHNGIVWALSQIGILWTQVFTVITQQINGLLTAVATFRIDIAGIHTSLSQLVNQVTTATANIEYMLAKLIPGLSARITALEAKAVAYDAMVAEQNALRAQVTQNVADITHLKAAAITVDATLGIDGRRIDALQGQLTQVLPLALLGTLGLTAIRTLAQVAEDPCFCMSGAGNLSDLTERVLALENAS